MEHVPDRFRYAVQIFSIQQLKTIAYEFRTNEKGTSGGLEKGRYN